MVWVVYIGLLCLQRLEILVCVVSDIRILADNPA